MLQPYHNAASSIQARVFFGIQYQSNAIQRKPAKHRESKREREREWKEMSQISRWVCRWFVARSSTGQPAPHAQAPQATKAAPNGQSSPVPQIGSWEGDGSWGARSPFQGWVQCFSLPQLTDCTAVCSQPHPMHLSVPPKVLAMSQHENVTQESRDWTMLGRKDKKSTAQNRSQHVTMTRAVPGPPKGMRMLHLGERRWDMSRYARLEVRCKLNPNNLLYIHLIRGLEKLDFSKSRRLVAAGKSSVWINRRFMDLNMAQQFNWHVRKWFEGNASILSVEADSEVATSSKSSNSTNRNLVERVNGNDAGPGSGLKWEASTPLWQDI